MAPPPRRSYEGKTDHDLLIELNTKFDDAIPRLDNHGRRIRDLEIWKWTLSGALIVLGVIVKVYWG